MMMNEKLASALAAFCSVALIQVEDERRQHQRRQDQQAQFECKGEGVALEGAGGEVDEQNSNQPAHLLTLRPSTRGRWPAALSGSADGAPGDEAIMPHYHGSCS